MAPVRVGYVMMGVSMAAKMAMSGRAQRRAASCIGDSF